MAMYRTKILSMRYTSVKNRNVNCFTLPMRSLLGGPYTKFQCLVKTVAISCAVAVRTGSALEGFEKRSVITSNAVLLLFYSISRLKMSILTFVSGSVVGNRFNAVARFWM